MQKTIMQNLLRVNLESMLEDLEELGWKISDINTLPIILEKPERDTRMTAKVVLNLGNDGTNHYTTIRYQLNTPDGVYEDNTIYCKDVMVLLEVHKEHETLRYEGIIRTKEWFERTIFGHLEAYLSGETTIKEEIEVYEKYKIK